MEKVIKICKVELKANAKRLTASHLPLILSKFIAKRDSITYSVQK